VDKQVDPPNSKWYLYILECCDGSYYTGITRDIPGRLERHNLGKGAKFTRSRRPVRLVYFEERQTERAVRHRELELKGWRRKKKAELALGFPSSALTDILRVSGQ